MNTDQIEKLTEEVRKHVGLLHQMAAHSWKEISAFPLTQMPSSPTKKLNFHDP